MVHIKKGSVELTVSRGAYDSFYRRCGFEAQEDTRIGQTDLTHENVYSESLPPCAPKNDSTADSEEFEGLEVDYSEIPLSELSYEQLCDYADQMGIDRDGIKSPKGLRALIKANR